MLAGAVKTAFVGGAGNRDRGRRIDANAYRCRGGAHPSLSVALAVNVCVPAGRLARATGVWRGSGGADERSSIEEIDLRHRAVAI